MWGDLTGSLDEAQSGARRRGQCDGFSGSKGRDLNTYSCPGKSTFPQILATLK